MIEDDGGFMRRETEPEPSCQEIHCFYCGKDIDESDPFLAWNENDEIFCNESCKEDQIITDYEMLEAEKFERDAYGDNVCEGVYLRFD